MENKRLGVGKEVNWPAGQIGQKGNPGVGWFCFADPWPLVGLTLNLSMQFRIKWPMAM